MSAPEETIAQLGDPSDPGVFMLKDCALIAIATGKKVLMLRELLDRLHSIDHDSIYFHFWGGLLQPRFEEREYNNDFAAWVRHGLHDLVLAERLAVVDPTDYPDLEHLRQELIDLIEARLDESSILPWMPATRQFEFIRSQIVVFDTHNCVETPEVLAELMPTLSTTSLFYHFIDGRRRSSDHSDDFSTWLGGFEGRYDELRGRLATIDPYFSSLTELREQLVDVFDGYFGERG
jgi:hypothetical protein